MRRFTRLCAAILAVLGLILGAVAFADSASAYPPGKTASINLNKSCGPAGSQVVVIGHNFTPRATVSLTFHSTPTPLGTVTVTAGGTFNVKVTVPAGSSGQHQIVATSTAGEVATAAFTAPCSGSGASGAGGNSGGLAGTGVAVISISVVGLVLLVVGGLFLVSSRRRRASV